MSMVQLTILQCLLAFFLYTMLTIAVPAVVIYPRVKHCRPVTRILTYFTLGNFYIMNLVYALELLHISYRFTLVVFTVFPVAFAAFRVRGISFIQMAKDRREKTGRLLRGTYGVKNWLHRGWRGLRVAAKSLLRYLVRNFFTHLIDIALFAATVGTILYFYGPNLIETFGYCTSDMPVHTYWINYLVKNKIFVAGVYPFGFHNVIYYIRTVFGIDTYVLMRVFCLVQNLWIHFMLLIFLKGVCRSRYLPYFGVMAFAAIDFNYYSYMRYFSSLPQEFGMLFILPAVYFAFEFFRFKKLEIKGVQEQKVTKYYLACFAMNFAMTFSSHFYDTIILGIFCVGIAIGYIWRFLQPKYFVKVVSTCFLGLFVAVLPLAIAFITGTDLEGSLHWAIEVMTPSTGGESEDGEVGRDLNGIPLDTIYVQLDDGNIYYRDYMDNGDAIYYPIDIDDLTEEAWEQLLESGYDGDAIPSAVQEAQEREAQEEEQRQLEEAANKKGFAGRSERLRLRMKQRQKALEEKLSALYESVDMSVSTWMLTDSTQPVRYVLYLALLLTPILTLLLLLFRQFDDAFSLFSVGVHLFLMVFLLAMPDLGLPTIMEQTRTSIYLCYSLPVLCVLVVDRALYLVFGIFPWRVTKHVMNLASLALVVLGCATVVQMDLLKDVRILDAGQSNEAVTCLTNIIHDEKDMTWTIVSAFDELRLGEDHGYHVELSTFLNDMEYGGYEDVYTIPTQSIYFFVEKQPIDYYGGSYEGSGQMISEEGASRMLPSGGGYNDYKGESRWILMSRMYEWAQKFQQLYPNDLQVYYEDDKFVCYKLEQNSYHLFNLAIDYDYNTRWISSEELTERLENE